MKSFLYGISAIALIVTASTAGCGKSIVEAGCAKASECGTLKGQTEAQCVTNGEKVESALHGSADCKDLAAKFDALQECGNALSCDDVKQNAVATKCKQQLEDFGKTASAAPMSCQQALAGAITSGGGEGGGSSSSSTSGEGSTSSTSGEGSTSSTSGASSSGSSM